MLQFIDHLDPEEYWFSGSFYSPLVSVNPKPLAVSGSFLQDRGNVVFEGTYRFAPGDVSHPFSLHVTERYVHAFAVELRSAHTGTLVGHMYSLGQAYDLLVAGEAGRSVGAHIQLVRKNDLYLTGVIQLPQISLGFEATGSPGEDREGLGNVVSLHGGRRA